MARTPLYAALRRIARDTHREARHAEGLGPTRRDVLRGAAATALLPALAPAVAPIPARAAGAVKVAVVGAGLAGLAATYDLKKAGIDAVLYEGNTRLGGRCWTIRDAFAGGQVGEHGGEFIDTDHGPIRRLVKELGLELDNVLAAQPAGSHALYYFDGTPYSVAQAQNDYRALYPTVQDQAAKIGSYDYRSSNAFARALDRITVAEWVALYVKGGRASRLGRLIEDAISEELAADVTALSGLNVPVLFAADTQDGFNLYYAGSDQRFHVHGGNDQIVSRLAALLPGQIETGVALNAVTRLPDGRIRLGLSRDSVAVERVYDRVILAIPFAVMRAAVDTSRAGFRPLKQRAIRELGMGASVKFQLQFSRRVWHDFGCNGEVRRPSPYFQTTWDVTRAQSGRQGVLNFWSGGTQAIRSGRIDAATLAQRCLTEAEVLLPGLADAWTGRMTRDVWKRNPWSLGSYAYPPLGYSTEVFGIEPEPEGHCYFAGEHTYVQQTGYLNAGVASGQRAVRQVLRSLAA